MTTSSDIATWTRLSVLDIDRTDLAYLTLSGKVELPMRDHLANWCRKNFPELTVAREWMRHDLALLGRSGPDCIVEGKLWAHFNMLDDKKLNSLHETHGIRGAMEKDVQKIRKSSQQFDCDGFISTLMMTIDVSEVAEKHLRAIKYLPNWKRELNRGVSVHLRHELATEKLLALSEGFGTTACEEVFSGSAYGASVSLVVVATKVT